MTRSGRSRQWVMGGGVAIVVAVLFPLWLEFKAPGNLAWNSFLAVLLTLICAAAVSLQRYLRAHVDEVGEARFDTRNKTHG